MCMCACACVCRPPPFCRMSETEKEKLGSVLANGIGHDSPTVAVGVSGNKPMVNGDLRENEKDEFSRSGAVPAVENTVGDSVTATAVGDILAVKVYRPWGQRGSRERFKSRCIGFVGARPVPSHCAC